MLNAANKDLMASEYLKLNCITNNESSLTSKDLQQHIGTTQ